MNIKNWTQAQLLCNCFQDLRNATCIANISTSRIHFTSPPLHKDIGSLASSFKIYQILFLHRYLVTYLRW